jgi:hypothetical protein
MEFTGVELVALVEKDVASPMEKAPAGPRTLEGHDV